MIKEDLKTNLEKLLEVAKAKNNILEIDEINDFFGKVELTVEQMEVVYQYMAENNVEVVEKEDPLEAAPEAILEGVSTDDPVRMYLKK